MELGHYRHGVRAGPVCVYISDGWEYMGLPSRSESVENDFSVTVFTPSSTKLAQCTPDPGNLDLTIDKDGQRRLYRSGEAIPFRTAFPDGKVEHGHLKGQNVKGSRVFPKPAGFADGLWVFKEDGTFSEGKLKEGVVLKKDAYGRVHTFTEKGDYIAPPGYDAAEQKIAALADMIDRQTEEMKAMKTALDELRQAKS